MAAKYSETITTLAGTALANVKVQALDSGGVAQTLYTDAALTIVASPESTAVYSDEEGLAEFYVADGTYTIVHTYRSTTKTFANVELYDLSNLKQLSSDLASTASGKGAGLVGVSHAASYSAGTIGKTIQQRGIVITDAPFNAPTDGTTDIAPYIEAGIAALSGVDNFLLLIPDGDFTIGTELLFTDKNITLRGAGEGLTRLHFTSATASIKFLDTSTTTGWNVHKQFNASDFTCVIDYTTASLTGAPIIDVVGSYTGIISSWHHGSIQRITIQGQSATKYFNKAIRLTDVGQFSIDQVRADNGGAQASNSTCFIEIKRSAASNITSFPITNCYCYGTKYGILFTHASATQAGSIEGVWCNNSEFVGVRHAFYDDNQGTSNTTKTLNGISFIAGFASYSFSFAKLGYATNIDFSPNYSIGSNLADTGAALEAAIEITTYAEEVDISSSRWVRDAAMATATAVVLPTRDSCKRVRIEGNSFAAWDAIVDQVGTATTDKNRIYLSDNQHEGVPTSTTASGFTNESWHTLYKSAVGIPHTGDTVEYTAVTKSILGGSIGPNGHLRVTFIMSTASSTANSKTVRVKLGSTTMWARAETTGLIGQYCVEICNRNSQSSQIVNQASSGGWGFSSGAAVTATEDTSTSLNLSITLQLANSGETITLESYLIEVLYGE